MTKDARKVLSFATPRIGGLALSAEQKAAFQKIGQEQKALAEGLVAFKREGELRARVKRERREEASWRLAAETSEAELAVRIVARRGVAAAPPVETPEPQAAGETPASPEAETAVVEPAVGHSGRALVRRFLDQQPTPETSAARIREAMGGRGDNSAPAAGSWTANEAERLNRQLNVPSESTIQRELNELQASVTKG